MKTEKSIEDMSKEELIAYATELIRINKELRGEDGKRKPTKTYIYR